MPLLRIGDTPMREAVPSPIGDGEISSTNPRHSVTSKWSRRTRPDDGNDADYDNVLRQR